ncbi:MAG: DUF481 domain-containing protein [Pirellulales bacterium]|nr:DUF481 domain-containing protein [Pirellulales bacterium]
MPTNSILARTRRRWLALGLGLVLAIFSDGRAGVNAADTELLPPPETLSAEPLVTPPSALPAADKIPGEQDAEAPELVIKPEPVIHPWFYYKAWAGSFDLGVNGSEGNSQTFNLRTGLNAKREVPWSITTLRFDYVNNSANSLQTADRAFFDGRYEWLFEASPWSLYIHETTEYDEFRAFNVRVTADAGVGYQFWKNDLSSMKARIGPGASREFGGTDESWTPELVFGLYFDRQISKLQKINFSVDYFPQIDDFMSYRLNSQVNWEVVLDQVNNLSMKIGVVDRYDSTPQGKKPNDVDYRTVLVWNF